MILLTLLSSGGCGSKKNSNESSVGGKGGSAPATEQLAQSAVTGVEFTPKAAAAETGTILGIATAARAEARGLIEPEELPGAPPRKPGARPALRRQAEADSTPIPGAILRLEGTSFETSSDPSGKFRMPFVPPGSYVLIGEKQAAGGNVYSFLQEITVPAGSEIDLGALTLLGTGEIRGKVTRADATSHLGTNVFIPGTSLFGATDDDGNFRILYVPPGTHKLVAMYPGFDPSRWQDVRVESKTVSDLTPVELKHSPPGKAKTASVFGRIVATGGGGIRDAVISSTPPLDQTVQSDSTGSFTISNVSSGVYLLRATHPAFSEGSALVDLIDKTFGEVEIRLAPKPEILASATGEKGIGSPPSVTLDVPATVLPGTTITLRAKTLDTDTSADRLTLRWKVSGGSLAGASGREVEWAAPAKGVYTVEASVSDGILTDRASAIISVAQEGEKVSIDTTVPLPPRPDKLIVKSHPPGTEDELSGNEGCVEGGATVKVFADGLFQSLLATSRAGENGAFGPIKLGDNRGDANDLVYIALYDAAGNLSPVYFVLNDKTAPDTVLLVTPCAAGQTTCLASKDAATFEFSASEPGAAFKCKLDKGEFASCKSPHAVSKLSNGSHLLALRAEDSAGNVDPSPVSFSWSVDATLPSVGTLAVTKAGTATHVGGVFDLSAPITEQGSSLSSCEICLSTDGTCDTEWKPATLTGLPPNYNCAASGLSCTDGQALTLGLRATDQALNSGEATALSRACDTKAPATGAATPSGWVSADQSIALTPSDTGGSGVTGGVAATLYCVDSDDSCNPATSGTSAAVTCSAGATCDRFVRFFSRDAVGNQEGIQSSRVRIDKQAPGTSGSVAINPVGGSYMGSNYTLSAAFTESGSGITSCQYCVATAFQDGGACTPGWSNGTISSNNCSAGSLTCTNGSTYYFKARASDALGNGPTEFSQVNYICDTVGPVANVSTDVWDGWVPATGAGVDQDFVTDRPATLKGGWQTYVENGSGLERYEYAIGTTNCAGASPTNVIGYTSSGTTRNISISASYSLWQKYYLNVRGVDKVGNVGACTSSDGFTVMNRSIQTANEAGSSAGLAIGTVFHVVYGVLNGADYDLRYASTGGSEWTTTDIATANSVGQYASVVLAGGTTLHVVYYDVTNGDLRYATCSAGCTTGTNWTNNVLIDGNASPGTSCSAAGDMGRFPALVQVPIGGQLAVVYYDVTNQALKYAECGGTCTTNTNWTCATIEDVANDVGQRPSLMSPSGSSNLHAGYYDATAQDLKYATCTGTCTTPGNWTKVAIQTSNDSGSVSGIATGNAGSFNVVYYYEDAGPNYKVKHSSCTSSCTTAGNWSAATDIVADCGVSSGIKCNNAIALVGNTNGLNAAFAGRGSTSGTWSLLWASKQGTSAWTVKEFAESDVLGGWGSGGPCKRGCGIALEGTVVPHILQASDGGADLGYFIPQ